MRKLSLTIVVTLESWYWQSAHALKSLMKMLFFKEVHSCLSKKIDLWVQNSIFENVFQIILSHQIRFQRFMKVRSNLRKNFFFIFLKNFASFLSTFGFKMKQNWVQNFWKCRFVKNEALNQKSGSVKVLGYA